MNVQIKGTVALHVFDAGGKLGAWSDRISAAFEPAVLAVSCYLELNHVDVVVYASDAVIPELGINAFTENGHLVRLWLDPSHPRLTQSFDLSFPALLAHELHHLVREQGPGYGKSLRESLVSEGLACQFEREVVGQLPVYGIEVPMENVSEQLSRVAPYLDGPFLPDWMFGSYEKSIERSFGYRLGSTLVGQWLKNHRRTAADAVHVEANRIAEGW